ncbi:low-specificity L-threonine aldolase [candidate division KSB1 bacterium]|nr:low-specificity L-threonine aldolase [candidate division KSB1 bacterium]NIR72634.1 low-specificity L-threonine aldolase [candidate division KSB1 bacterium]NIS27345.1 low-specificity L-threonine aldolase [candidate division KSB1 bacterium]NIT73558.1 low-specificity L-threonine aldolase [candidate division KSB1 bacterium]NIU25406.1 low-specificity L-threonine aldolase [candidate division KSB1 bacterium]
MQMIDLRSDTVTKPSPAMRQAMAVADVGDDVFGEDPMVNKLQEQIAALFGKESALFVPSGTMGNEICINCHTRPGDEVICETGCHIFNYESGAAPFLSGVQMRPVVGERGVMTAEQVEQVISPPQDHFPQSALITVENTHNGAGGTIFPLDELKRLFELAQNRRLKLHLDGARIWNASVATDTPLKDYGHHCDSISVCFSKGLGAPVGSVIAGSRQLIAEAHRLRKIYGGGMRQVGILAAGALHALEHNLNRLKDDHNHARILAQALSNMPGIEIDLDTVQTNIVIFDIAKTGLNVLQFLEQLKERGVLVVPFGGTRIRAVTHLDVTKDDVETAVEIFKDVFD